MGAPAYSYVRMSTDAQIKGDSLRRQLEASRRYAAENDLELREDFALSDMGVSAYTGENIATGALGRFLAAVQQGKIARGSYLLVESLDRISRQKPQVALPQLLSIVNQGIFVVTLCDGRKFTPEDVTMEDMLISLVTMSRAHEDSAMKSRRVGAAWSNKRLHIDDMKMTARCPGWLTLTADKRKFEILPERREIVIQIFAEACAGIGAYSIAKRFNMSGVCATSKLPRWVTNH